jgi:hypothetical protein
MSKDLKPKKKSNINKPAQAQASRRANLKSQTAFPLLFSLQNYKWMIIGCALIGLGLLLMLGGNMKDPNVWDENVIYSFRRTLIAPLVILAGLGLQIYAIFKK